MSNGQRLRFEDIEFDPGSGELMARGATTRLAHQPALVLSTLAGRPGEIVTRSELHAAVWGADTHVDYEQSLNFCIREIRKALGDSAGAPRFIETFPKRGYRWIATGNGSPATGRRPAPRVRWPLAATLAAGVLLGVGLEHTVQASPLHDRAIDWVHQVLQVDDASCPFGQS